MVLGDITNTLDSHVSLDAVKVSEPRKTLRRSLSQEFRVEDCSEAVQTVKADPVTALGDQRERSEALLEKVLPARARMKELKTRKALAEQRAAELVVELGKAKEEHENKLFAMSEEEVQLSEQLEVAKVDVAPIDMTHERLSNGVEAKKAQLRRNREEVENLVAAKAAKEEEGRVKVLRSAAILHACQAESEIAAARAEFMAQNVPAARALHNGYLNLKGNIRVFCRFRPKLASECSEMAKVDFHDDEQRLTLHGGVQKNVTGLSDVSSSWDFSFDRVFGPSSTQEMVFEEISLLVQSALDGYKVAIFAYGQTGGGKTYTMDGPQGVVDAPAGSQGVIPRTVDLIFAEVQELREKGWNFSVSCTLLEVYNEAVHDILAARSTSSSTPAVGTDARQAVDQFTARKVDNAAAVHRLLDRAARERHVASTACNDRSSRSHAVFQLSIVGKRGSGDELEEVSGLLSLVDLAGSERVERSQVTGERLKEAQYINKSLSALGDVVEALARRGATGNAGCHVPYRNSRLTMLLKDSLGGESKALMFVNASPCAQHMQETLSSLRFASKVHACNVGVAKRCAVESAKDKEASKTQFTVPGSLFARPNP